MISTLGQSSRPGGEDARPGRRLSEVGSDVLSVILLWSVAIRLQSRVYSAGRGASADLAFEQLMPVDVAFDGFGTVVTAAAGSPAQTCSEGSQCGFSVGVDGPMRRHRPMGPQQPHTLEIARL